MRPDRFVTEARTCPSQSVSDVRKGVRQWQTPLQRATQGDLVLQCPVESVSAWRALDIQRSRH